MRRLIEEEDLNLQDLIFILLFFFVISQTLIVFKVQKDLIVPPKVDKDPEIAAKDQSRQMVHVVIDEASTVFILAGDSRVEVLPGFDPGRLKATVAEYCDPAAGRNLFLPTEEAEAYQSLVLAVKKLKTSHRLKMPQVNLVADHRARYGTIFQVNVAVQSLIADGEIDPSVRWKVYVDKDGRESLFDKALKPGL